MKNIISVSSPEVLHFGSEMTLYGPNQEWYSERWQKQAGCGATACSAVLWYMAKNGAEGLIKKDYQGKSGIISLMEEIWEYITPTRMGVNDTSLFADGVSKYGDARNMTLECDILDVPKLGKKPGYNEVAQFLKRSFEKDVPVAFLNLSNGKEKRLESWHWVTLMSLDTDSGIVTMYDQSRRVQIDLRLWLRTTLLGGGFVSIQIK